MNEIKTAAQDGHAQTGMGPGWVAVTYKANGPVVGYLFARGFTFADGQRKPGSDHMDVRGTGIGTAGNTQGINRWPWGYAAGGVDGCVYAYGTRKFARTRPGFMTDRCAGGPTVSGSHKPGGRPDRLRWWQSERRVFCTSRRADALCSRYGVWSKHKGGGLKATTPKADCPVYGNIGAAAVYGTGPARPQHPLGTVPAVDPATGTKPAVDVRYVTRDRQWVMAKWRGHQFAGGIAWAFFPRSCLA